MTIEERNELVCNYMPLADKLAWLENRKTPNSINIEELKAAAYMGLVNASRRYNPDLSGFGTYASIRVRGSIKDYLRELRQPMVSLDFSEGWANSIESKADHDSHDFFDVVAIDLDAIGEKAIRMYYMDGYSLKDIGKKVGVTESRVSQILKKQREKIRCRWEQKELWELAA